MIPPDVQQFVDFVVDMAEDIKVERCDPLAKPDDFIHLDDTAMPDWARGNCYTSSSAILDATQGSRYAHDLTSMDVQFVLGATLSHSALYLHGYAIDFTARQFDQLAAWPLVLPLDEWKAWLIVMTDQPILRFSGIHLPS